MTFRRRKDKEVWHCCRNCSSWPTSDYVEQQAKPDSGHFCYQCTTKLKNQECSSYKPPR